jgi:hypothetical protein
MVSADIMAINSKLTITGVAWYYAEDSDILGGAFRLLDWCGCSEYEYDWMGQDVYGLGTVAVLVENKRRGAYWVSLRNACKIKGDASAQDRIYEIVVHILRRWRKDTGIRLGLETRKAINAASAVCE